ncbi:hypothetical protein AB0K05_28660 [Nonomuraea sp. NPDC049486]|uniref:hypothetical protein n=1 Tax=unclassified Nonomuraea TaxID=2593643 RepID=UPI00342C5CB5
MMSAPLAGFEERRLAELKEYVAARARRRPRPRLLLAAAAAVTMMTAGGVAVMTAGGGDPAYAVTMGSDGVVDVVVRDFRDTGGLTEQLHELGVPAIVDYVPYGMMCREPRAEVVEQVPPGLYHAPTTIPGEREGWQMRIDTKRFEPGQTFVWTMTVNPRGASSTSTILMRDPVAPCELVPDDRRVELDPGKPATGKGGPLEGVRVEGKTVAELDRELRKHGLPVMVNVIRPDPDAPEGFVVYAYEQSAYEDDYVVWAADVVHHGDEQVIRLLVTEKRYPENPVRR